MENVIVGPVLSGGGCLNVSGVDLAEFPGQIADPFCSLRKIAVEEEDVARIARSRASFLSFGVTNVAVQNEEGGGGQKSIVMQRILCFALRRGGSGGEAGLAHVEES